MKSFDWNSDKNHWLRSMRGISFEDIVYQIDTDHLLDVIEHGDPQKYPGQRIFVVDVDGYVFLVPFVESEGCIFLKTIIPSRKATKQYLRKK